MATIHRKKSIIKKRQTTWSPKDKKAFEMKKWKAEKKAKSAERNKKIKSAVSGFVSTTISGMKMIGGRIVEGAKTANSEKHRNKMDTLADKLGEFGRRSGEVFGGDVGVGYSQRKRRKR